MNLDQILPFSVYVEKFDSELTTVKMSDSEWNEVRAGVINTFMLEKNDVQMKLYDKCEKYWFNSEQGFAIYFMKSKFAQDFTIRAINENLKLADIKARGPRTSQHAKRNELCIMSAQEGGNRGRRYNWGPRVHLAARIGAQLVAGEVCVNTEGRKPEWWTGC